MTSQQPLRSLSDSERHGQDQYRSLSVLAVVALSIGLVSVVALVHPGAWFVPGLAAICGLLALRRIRREPDSLMGAPLAVVGVVLGLFFLSWAPTSFFVDRWMINQQARQFSEEWLTAVFSGQTGQAFQATLPVRSRQPKGTALDEFYQDDSVERADRDAYFDKDLAKELADLQGIGRFQFDRSLGVFLDSTYMLVTPRYYIYRPGQDEPALHLQMEVIRETDGDGVYWTLIKLADVDEIDRPVQHRSLAR